MPDLIAQGGAFHQRWRRTLREGRSYVIGRARDVWNVPWDSHISRRHAEIRWEDGRLEVRQLSEAGNPIFIQGKQRLSFSAKPGDHFVIGETTFQLADEEVNISLDAPSPVTEQAYSQYALQQSRFRNADQRIDVLSRLPEIISGASDDAEIWVRFVNMLLAGIPNAAAAAILSVQGETRVLHWDRRRQVSGAFEPSEKLIRRSTETGESVVHVWETADSVQSFTNAGDAEWAFCTPVVGGQGWAIYVAGDRREEPSSSASFADLRDDLKFAELTAATLGRLYELRASERRIASLSQFISPVVLDAIADRDPDVMLAPREADVTVLFCDLRGFSRRSEQNARNLLELLNRVSGALGVMTRSILAHGGVVGDFHGDAAMGFWGWPLQQADAARRAAEAALAIRHEFETAARDDDHPLVDFRIGIGVASGRAVAGKIGTVDQVKVTVFGPVVNLAARLEGMTKRLRTPILVDEPTAQMLRQAAGFDGRLRRLAKLRPYGLKGAVEVSELLPCYARSPELNDDDLATYERALDALIAGDWDASFNLLHAVPAADRAKDFLTVFIAQHNRTPPNGWDGVIELDSK